MRTLQLEDTISKMDHFDEELIKSNCPPKLFDVIGGYMEEKNISRSDLIRKMNIDRNYGYQLLNGTRTPTRTHLIQIGLILELDTDSLQQLLKIAGKNPLYVRDMTDAKIFYAIKHQMKYEDAVPFIWGDSLNNKLSDNE
ncbi:MAG: helix-turn-helix domain-containing protein [Huintestinicola sp.]